MKNMCEAPLWQNIKKITWHPSSYEYSSIIKHLLFCDIGSGPRWVTVPYYYQSHHHQVCVCVCEWNYVFIFYCRGVGGAVWTNMSFQVSGCRANIDQRALQHVAGQIKHRSGTKNQWYALSPGWISLHLSDWSHTHHTGRETERCSRSLGCFLRYFFFVFFTTKKKKNSDRHTTVTAICKVYESFVSKHILKLFLCFCLLLTIVKLFTFTRNWNVIWTTFKTG